MSSGYSYVLGSARNQCEKSTPVFEGKGIWNQYPGMKDEGNLLFACKDPFLSRCCLFNHEMLVAVEIAAFTGDIPIVEAAHTGS